jgi:hypothetical protein
MVHTSLAMRTALSYSAKLSFWERYAPWECMLTISLDGELAMPLPDKDSSSLVVI